MVVWGRAELTLSLRITTPLHEVRRDPVPERGHLHKSNGHNRCHKNWVKPLKKKILFKVYNVGAYKKSKIMKSNF